MRQPIIEACVSSLSEGISAQNNGADRIELCARLDLDGLTPDIQLIKAAISALDIPIKVMIRPREGDFIYSSAEKAIIREQIQTCYSLGIRDYVYGSIREDRLDIEDIMDIYKLLTEIGANSMTIHKAIDVSKDPLIDLQLLLELIPPEPSMQLAVLSSGGASTALQGAALLNQMISLVGEKIEIIAAGKISSTNLDVVKEAIPARAYHGRRIVPLID